MSDGPYKVVLIDAWWEVQGPGVQLGRWLNQSMANRRADSLNHAYTAGRASSAVEPVVCRRCHVTQVTIGHVFPENWRVRCDCCGRSLYGNTVNVAITAWNLANAEPPKPEKRCGTCEHWAGDTKIWTAPCRLATLEPRPDAITQLATKAMRQTDGAGCPCHAPRDTKGEQDVRDTD